MPPQCPSYSQGCPVTLHGVSNLSTSDILNWIILFLRESVLGVVGCKFSSIPGQEPHLPPVMTLTCAGGRGSTPGENRCPVMITSLIQRHVRPPVHSHLCPAPSHSARSPSQGRAAFSCVCWLPVSLAPGTPALSARGLFYATDCTARGLEGSRVYNRRSSKRLFWMGTGLGC